MLIPEFLKVFSDKKAIVTDTKVLKQVSRETTIEEVRQMDLVARLRKANNTAWTSGCGLAAIQIGEPVRFAWFVLKGKEHKLLNPEIIEKRVPVIHRGEGCLSIPNFRKDVLRYHKIVYVSDGVRKKAKGLKAYVIQHEIDHMNGILITDDARGPKCQY